MVFAGLFAGLLLCGLVLGLFLKKNHLPSQQTHFPPHGSSLWFFCTFFFFCTYLSLSSTLQKQVKSLFLDAFFRCSYCSYLYLSNRIYESIFVFFCLSNRIFLSRFFVFFFLRFSGFFFLIFGYILTLLFFFFKRKDQLQGLHIIMDNFSCDK
ncbi:hypothetical protein EDC94DRAFT_251846 [Helicostylum pulchrum]|nr:hypothetical protein EDC94DRAFT_251846 [Helicostylum pulchrum]